MSEKPADTAGPDATTPTAPVTADTPDTESTGNDEHGAPRDVRDAFKEALARKNAKSSGPHSGHEDGDSKAHGPQGKAGAKREFRRKSG